MDIEKEIDEIVNKTGRSRLEVISNMNLGPRSDAAKRVIEKRNRRKELIESGFSFDIACVIVNRETELGYFN